MYNNNFPSNIWFKNRSNDVNEDIFVAIFLHDSLPVKAGYHLMVGFTAAAFRTQLLFTAINHLWASQSGGVFKGERHEPCKLL